MDLHLRAVLQPRAEYTNDWGFNKNQNLEVLHVCKCTCFTTNTTLIPLHQAAKGNDLCSSCTKQFCVDRAEGCHGAKIVESTDDSSTGYEGQVWAKCFGTCRRVLTST